MMPGDEIRALAGQVRALMHERLGARGATLAEALASRRRALPRRLRAPAQALAEAEAIAMAPRLARQADMAALRAHGARLAGYLGPLGRRGRVVSATVRVVAGLVAGMIVIAAVALLMLARRGVIGP